VTLCNPGAVSGAGGWTGERREPARTGRRGLAGGTGTWDLSNGSQKVASLNLSLSPFLWVEGVFNGGPCNIKLAFRAPWGTEICSDTVKYTFIAAVCGRQPKTDQPSVRYKFQDGPHRFENLRDCEWSIIYDASGQYNCIAWSVLDQSNWYTATARRPGHPQDIPIDVAWGDGNGTLTFSELDAFYDEKGYLPTGTSPTDCDVMYYSLFHAARKMGCSCGAGKWTMFESKCGDWECIEHEYDQLDGMEYGYPIRFYKHK
jgi:hypothetical protein